LKKKKFGKISHQIVGWHPAKYQLDKVSRCDEQAAKSFVADLAAYEAETERPIGLLQVVDPHHPTRMQIIPQLEVEKHIELLNKSIDDIKISHKTSDEKVLDLVSAMTMSAETRNKIADETTEQACSRSWHAMREKRITASKCHRIVSYTGRAGPTSIVNEILQPRHFSTAATQYGLDNEPLALSMYAHYLNDHGDTQATVSSAGFYTQIETGYLGASPDGIVHCGDGQIGIIEIKCPPSWANTIPSKAVTKKGYPLHPVSTVITPGRVKLSFKLKESSQWFQQIQMALYCCKDFASFSDFVMLHCDTQHLHVERILLSETWVAKYVPKMEQFYIKYIAPKILDIN
jgi:hypothetical protein